MKANLISLSVFLVAGFFWYLSKWDHDRKQDLKKFPEKFAYYIPRHDSIVHHALGSEDRECSVRIKEYFETLDRGGHPTLPTCVDYWVRTGETVHVLSEEDSITMKVAYFYISSNGRERHVVGYLLKKTLHETPYVKKNKDPDI